MCYLVLLSYFSHGVDEAYIDYLGLVLAYVNYWYQSLCFCFLWGKL